MLTSPFKILALTAVLGLTLTGCSTSADNADGSASTAASNTSASSAGSTDSAAGDTFTVEDNHGTQTVPKNPQRVAVTDNRSFEILAQWDIPLVAAPVQLIPATVSQYKEDARIADIGSHREPNLEELAAQNPDLIVNGQRFRNFYEDIAALNPEAALVEFEPREGQPWDQELRRHTESLGKVFSKEAEAQKLIEDFDAALKRAQDAYDGNSTVMAVTVSGGKIGYIAPSVGRTFGPLFDLLNLKPALEVENSTDGHKGDDVSVETIAHSNPQWIFVMDRDAGTSARTESGYQPARDVVQGNEALKNVDAIKSAHVLYAPEDTYTNENIITYTEILNSIADAFEAAA